VATNTWYALQALEHIDFDWGPAPHPETNEGHRERVEEAFEGEPFYRKDKRGDVESALDRGQLIEGSYRVPYLAHAAMEPLNATARLESDRLEIWAGNQFPDLAQLVGAQLTGLDRDSVAVHTPYMGGGFGRRFAMNDVTAAVLAAKAYPGRPVRVTYSREEDFTHDTYRPLASARFRASVDDGSPVALDLEVSAPSIFASGDLRRHALTGEPLKGPPSADVSISMGAADQPYTIENYRVTTYRAEELLPVGWWRSVGSSQNCFFHESAVDEIAHAAGADPLTMRLNLLDHRPSRKVLESVAEMSDWGSELPEGRARGVAFSVFKKIPTAAVVEISLEGSKIRLVRAFTAVDVGIALDRRNIRGQVQGAFAFGLSSSIFGEITVRDGAVEQTNFDDYPLLQMSQSPSIEVRILENGKKIRGVGEAATPVAGAALGNAIFAATGTRVRELPFSRSVRFA
jgi:isoquinoline 1-oxidoreductase beta subunit